MTGSSEHDGSMTTSTGSTTHHVTDPRPVLDRAIATGGAVIAGVRPDQLTAPTPCPEMDVRAMLSHLVGVLSRIAALGNDDDPLSVTEANAPDDDWSDAWATSGTHAADAWRDDAVLERPMALPWIQGEQNEGFHAFFRLLMRAVKDQAVEDPGPWRVDPDTDTSSTYLSEPDQTIDSRSSASNTDSEGIQQAGEDYVRVATNPEAGPFVPLH